MFTNNTTCFADDSTALSPSLWEAILGKNMARTFLSASLLPYVIFMYFVGYRGNGINSLTYFGFQYVLVFTVATVCAGVATKFEYGLSVTNVDWLHGAAEILLTVSNLALMYGLTDSMAQEKPTKAEPLYFKKFALVAYALAGLFLINAYIWIKLQVDPHFPLLFGLGDLPRAWVQRMFNGASHKEPDNALSIATWFVHILSEVEYFFIMNLVWNRPEVTKATPAWKGLTWGMLPTFTAGLCACIWHFFYNTSPFLADLHGAMTLVGNTTCVIAAYRIARANGWSLREEMNVFRIQSSSKSSSYTTDSVEFRAVTAEAPTSSSSSALLGYRMGGLTLALSYLAKYGAIALGCPVEPHPAVPLAIVFGISSVIGLLFSLKSRKESL